MTRYAVSGITSPDCTTEDTGEPAGTINGQPYWEWVVAPTTGNATVAVYGPPAYVTLHGETGFIVLRKST